MDIVITGIGKENLEPFAPLMPGLSLADYKICVGAIADGRACGVCLFDILGGALMLDYIYVAPKYRRSGVASVMIGKVRELSYDMGKLPIHVNYPESAEDLHRLFLSLGFLIFRDGKAYRVPAGAFLASKAFSDMMELKNRHKIKSLAELSKKEVLGFMGELYDEDCDVDIVFDASLSKELSFFAFNERTGAPESCMLCQENGDLIVILYMFIFQKDGTALADIIRRLRDEVQERKDAEKCEILFVTMNEKVRKFAEKMVDDETQLICEGNTISAILA